MGSYKKNSEKPRDILLRKITITIVLLIFIKIGSLVPVPGIDPAKENELPKNFITAFFSTFSIDGNVIIGLFTLNVIPYINASVILQVLIGLKIFPNLAESQK